MCARHTREPPPSAPHPSNFGACTARPEAGSGRRTSFRDKMQEAEVEFLDKRHAGDA